MTFVCFVVQNQLNQDTTFLPQDLLFSEVFFDFEAEPGAFVPAFPESTLLDTALADPVLADPALGVPVLADPVLADPVLAVPVLVTGFFPEAGLASAAFFFFAGR